MTFRCNAGSKLPLLASALLLALATFGTTAVCAQDDGTAVPPAPKVKQTDAAPDPDFKSPMKTDGPSGRPVGPGFGAGLPPGGPGQDSPGGPGGRFGFGAGGRRGFGARARMQGRGMGGGFGHKLDLTPLNLTDDQKAKIKDIRQANRDRARDFRQTLIQKQLALHNLIFSPTASDGQIRSARKEVRKAQDSLEEVGLDDLLQIRGMLTAEQRQRLPQCAPPPPGQRPGGPIGNATASATTSPRRIDK